MSVFYACVIPIIFVTMLYIGLSDLRKTKNKDGALEKYVDYQFEFPRQCIVQKNALSLTQAPMENSNTKICRLHSTQFKELDPNVRTLKLQHLLP